MSKTAGQRRIDAAQKLVAACSDPEYGEHALGLALRSVLAGEPPTHVAFRVYTPQFIRAALAQHDRADLGGQDPAVAFTDFTDFTAWNLSDELAEHPAVAEAVREIAYRRVAAWVADMDSEVMDAEILDEEPV